MNEARMRLYNFLSGIYLFEIDENQLAAMKSMQLPKADGTLGEGYALLSEFLKTANSDCIEELAVDYARIFLAAGVAQGLAAFPYESVYADNNRLVVSKSNSDVAKAYAEKGMKPAIGHYKIPNDHIGLELAFMAKLCEESDEAGQKSFFKEHLLSWYSGFCHDAEKYAQTIFYKAIAKTTCGFLELEGQTWATN